MKIGLKIALPFVVLMAVFIFFGFLFFYSVSYQTLYNRTTDQLESVTILKENELQNYFSSVTNEIEIIIAEFTESNELLTLLESDQRQSSSDKQLYTALKGRLNKKIGMEKSFSEYSVLGTDGTVIVSTNDTEEDKVKDSEDYFLNGKQGLSFKPFFYDPSSLMTVAVVSAPIKNATGNTVGVLIAKVNLNLLSNIMLERSGLGSTGETYIVDQFNTMVTESRFEAGSAFKRVVRSKGVQHCLSGKSANEIYQDYRDMEVIGAYRWMPASSACMVTEMDVSEAFGDLEQLKILFVFAGFALLIGSTGIALLLASRVTRRLQALRDSSKKIGDGDLSVMVPITSNDEIGQLATTFNNMAQQLHTYTRDLEEKIGNRTHELEHRLKFEQLIASVSARLMEADNLKEAITSSLRELGEQKNATGAEVYILKPNSTVMTSITEWVVDEKYRTPVAALTLDLSTFPSWEEQLKVNGSVLIHDVSKMPQALQQESTYLTTLGIKSVMALPFAIGVIVSGVIVVSNHDEPQDWNDKDISLLKTVAEMIGSALARDQSETLLRDQKQLLTKVISTIPEHVFWKDAHSTYLGCNTQFAKVAGLNSPEEIVGKTDYDMPWTKEEADHYRAIDHEVMVSGKPTLNLQETQRQADDNDVIVSTSKVPLVSDSGETFGILGMYSDITERVNFEKRLAESEAMFRMTANAIKEGITLSDEQGTFYVYNHEMEQLTGYSMAEANAAGNFHALLHPDNLLEEKDKVGEIANYQVGERYATDTKIRTKRGEERYLKVSTVVINHQTKRMFLSAFSDITELKDAEAALLHEKATVERKITLRTAELEKARVDLDTSLRLSQAETDKIKAILQSIGDGVLVLDQDRKILVVNHATVELSGFTQEELINTVYNDHLQFVFEKNGAENHGFIDKVYEEGMLTYMANHTTLLRKDGTKLSVSDSAAPLKDEGGKVIGCVMVFRDVSKEREVERMKDEFISIASHQLRTPLTALRWMTEIMEQPTTGPLTKDQAELIHDMRGSTKRLISLVNDLLNITRIESGRMTVDPLPTDLPELVRSVLTDTQVKFAIKKQQGILEADPSLPMISIDPKLIRQVYLNLIANASNYSAESSKVLIKVFVRDGFMVNEIIDTGLGIPASQQPHIFQKFFRADNATMANSDGTGLGLYLAKMAVEASGGQISFESVEGKGTTFRFTLPLAGSIPQKGEISLT